MRRTLAIVVVGAVSMMLVGVGIASSANGSVGTRGDNQMIPNTLIKSTLKFSPGRVGGDSGETLTWTHSDKTSEPHSITIVNETELPQTADEVFQPDCPSCEAAGDAHFAGGPPPVTFVDADGDGGLNTPGDSLWLPPGGQVSAELTADPGETLRYMCIIHPWMQGSINVRG